MIKVDLIFFYGVLEFRATHDPSVAFHFREAGRIVELEFQSNNRVTAKLGVDSFRVFTLFCERIGLVVPSELPFKLVALAWNDGVGVAGMVDCEVEDMNVSTRLIGAERMFFISCNMVVSLVERFV